jgi:creatinine amidohydrolase
MRWEEMTAPDIGALDRESTIVLLPLGSVEQHGHHMPVGTDSILAHSVCLSAATRRGRTVVLPPPWYGFSAHHMAFAGTVTMPAPALIALAEAIVESVLAHGFRRVAIVNGHGGNSGVISVLASTLGHRLHGKARIAAVTYFQVARDAIADLRESGPGGMGHACEFETAMMLHLRPDLVKMEHAVTLYPDPGSPYLTSDLLGAAPVSTYLDFKDVSPSGTFGDPSLATAEKGARFFEAVTDGMTQFLDDFANWPVDAGRRDA